MTNKEIMERLEELLDEMREREEKSLKQFEESAKDGRNEESEYYHGYLNGWVDCYLKLEDLVYILKQRVGE